MKNFNYDGQYPGYVNGDWVVDERDGHVWLNIPGVSVLENFPKECSLHFMENSKAYGSSNISFSDEIFKIESFKFDKILKRNKPAVGSRDYYETIIGNEINTSLPDDIPPGVTVGSIIISDKVSGKILNVINLRNVLVFDMVRDIKLYFAVAVRTAEYGLTTFTNVDLGNGRSITFDNFYVESPISVFESGKVAYSSPEDYLRFANTVPPTGNWFESYCNIGKYGEDQLIGPNLTCALNEEGLGTLNLEGEFQILRGFTGIKSIKMPYCPGLSLVMRITEFNDNGVKKPYLDLGTEKKVNFKFVTRMVEATR